MPAMPTYSSLFAVIMPCLSFSTDSLFSGGVVESMEKGDFFSEKVTKSILFTSVHDAVLYCQQGRNKEVHFIHTHTKIFCMFHANKHHKHFLMQALPETHF